MLLLPVASCSPKQRLHPTIRAVPGTGARSAHPIEYIFKWTLSIHGDVTIATILFTISRDARDLAIPTLTLNKPEVDFVLLRCSIMVVNDSRPISTIALLVMTNERKSCYILNFTVQMLIPVRRVKSKGLTTLNLNGE
jgi:hypothetical protein